MTTEISIIIVNYNAGDRLEKCIRCLNAQTLQPLEIIVVDNASTDNSLETALNRPNIVVIEAGENLGFAAANNLAAKKAKGEFIALLNPDAYADPDWLKELATAITDYPDVDAFGSLQLQADNPEILDGAGDAYHPFGLAYRGHYGWPTQSAPETGECFAPCAAAAIYRRSTFLSLGGFEEKFFCYFEDVDLGFRLQLSGKRAMQIKSAKVLHEGSGISGAASPFTVYHGHRNRIWTHYLNMPLVLLLPTLPFHFLTNLYLFARLTVAGNARAYLKAMVDAHKALPSLMSERRKRQKNRIVPIKYLARIMTWSPLKPMRKEADLLTLTPRPKPTP
ncbi:MAG: glycosyl transferase [Hyphococcus sp.]|nr:MAG: glycosyl transferase [Marinicaulis sp.]